VHNPYDNVNNSPQSAPEPVEHGRLSMLEAQQPPRGEDRTEIEAEVDAEDYGPPALYPDETLDLDNRPLRLRDRLLRQSKYVPGLGYRMHDDFRKSDIEALLVETGYIPPDTQLTAAELKGEQLSAWLREYDIYLPFSPAIPRTGNPPAHVASRQINIPTRLGYTSPNLTAFLTYHLLPLMPSHPQYPAPGTNCVICHGSYTVFHTPVLIKNCSRCRGHVFGYSCLRNWISSGRSESNKCPLCRTMWFKIRRAEARQVCRRWAEIEDKEIEIMQREEEAFSKAMSEGSLGNRAANVFKEGVMVTGEAMGLLVWTGTRWVKRQLGY
jgi:hypothetical protein